MANRWGNNGNSDRLYFGGAPKSLQMVTAAMKLKDAPWKTTMTNLENILKSRDITLPTKVHLVKIQFVKFKNKIKLKKKNYGFSSSHEWM